MYKEGQCCSFCPCFLDSATTPPRDSHCSARETSMSLDDVAITVSSSITSTQGGEGESSSLSFDIPFLSYLFYTHKETWKERSWSWEFEIVDRDENEFEMNFGNVRTKNGRIFGGKSRMKRHKLQRYCIFRPVYHLITARGYEVWKMGWLTRRLGQEFLAWNFERNAARLVRAPQKEESEIRGR